MVTRLPPTRGRDVTTTYRREARGWAGRRRSFLPRCVAVLMRKSGRTKMRASPLSIRHGDLHLLQRQHFGIGFAFIARDSAGHHCQPEAGVRNISVKI